MGLPTPEFPNYDGLSMSRPNVEVLRSPDYEDWNQLVAEVLALQGATGLAITATAAAGATTVSNVTITVKDARGVAATVPIVLDVFLSDSTAGVGLTATTASGTVQAKSASGLVINALTAKKYIKVQTLADGTFVLEITDSAKTLFKVCAINPVTGKTIVLKTLITADYGA